mmetsp:Transcript_119541/g.338322  ORF Transcript_119541/g.338322 Transcript_119541/m.338322 type:complete len:369 (+) Transcript_119541:24-1130(+)
MTVDLSSCGAYKPRCGHAAAPCLQAPTPKAPRATQLVYTLWRRFSKPHTQAPKFLPRTSKRNSEQGSPSSISVSPLGGFPMDCSSAGCSSAERLASCALLGKPHLQSPKCLPAMSSRYDEQGTPTTVSSASDASLTDSTADSRFSGCGANPVFEIAQLFLVDGARSTGATRAGASATWWAFFGKPHLQSPKFLPAKSTRYFEHGPQPSSSISDAGGSSLATGCAVSASATARAASACAAACAASASAAACAASASAAACAASASASAAVLADSASAAVCAASASASAAALAASAAAAVCGTPSSAFARAASASALACAASSSAFARAASASALACAASSSAFTRAASSSALIRAASASALACAASASA